MTKYLLDSHTLIWSIVDDTKLSDKVLKILEDEKNDLFVSAVSFWEIAIKTAKGKLDLKNFDIRFIPYYCDKLKIQPIPLMPDEAINAYKLPIYENHNDPFDRMLIYQCINNNYTLISKDNKMKFYSADGLNYMW